MDDFKKENAINEIINKIHLGIKLDDQEMYTVERALRSIKGTLTTPYCELVYHDEYGTAHTFRANDMNYRDDGNSVTIDNHFQIKYLKAVPIKQADEQ